MKTTAYRFCPTSVEQIAEVMQTARRHGGTIALRGSGRSYGDAAVNAGGIVVDLRSMDRVLEWNPETGVIAIEPGVTIGKLWQHILPDGWWPPVVPGTMHPTIGGCLGMNIHGKNNWKAGTIGEHVLSFDLLKADGSVFTVTPEDDLFRFVIGGLGLLGVIVRVTMQMKRVYSGYLDVRAWAEPDLAGMLRATDESKDEHNYVVGWIDCTVGGRALGRGQMHTADNLKAGEDADPERSLQIEHQVLPDRLFGLVPKAILHRLMAPVLNNLGVRAVNLAKYTANRTIGNHKRHRQTHVAFNFLLDYIPNWELAYGAGGMIQYQCFIPKETAYDAFADVIRRALKHGLPNYLGVLKRHRPDRFALSHAVDGFSLAQDYRVTRGNRARLKKLVQELDEIVLQAGGRFYFAKDSTLRPDGVRRFLGEETVTEFKRLKVELDPEGLLETDLYRRCFA
ncbi:MAG TPA: FAD-binding oxidoreductase [Anaerolineales bacterium]|nr:FAD-binding oxidoreductase [Anaerolineales bacterium]